MLKTLLASSGLALLVAWPALRPTEGPKPGDMAPEIAASEWFNSIGRAPTLSELRGKAVLIEFWATW